MMKKETWQRAWLLRAISCMDLTTPLGDDTPSVCSLVRQGGASAQHSLVGKLGIEKARQSNVAAGLCLSLDGGNCVSALDGPAVTRKVNVAAVSTGCPAGLSPCQNRVGEILAFCFCKAGARKKLTSSSPRGPYFGAEADRSGRSSTTKVADISRKPRARAHESHLAPEDLSTLRNVAAPAWSQDRGRGFSSRRRPAKGRSTLTLPVGMVDAYAPIREYMLTTPVMLVDSNQTAAIRTAKQRSIGCH